MKLLLFTIFWFGLVYLANCLIARKFKKIDIKLAILYFTTVAMIGVFGEVFLDTAYNFFVGNPLWRYNLLPIHGSYTSMYAPVVWGIYGIHLYLLHDTLAQKSRRRTLYLAAIFSVEALFVEALVTISAKIYLGVFLYYYFPGDLWHVTSIQNLPFYFICGIVIVQSIKRFRKDPLFFSSMATALTAVIVLFA